MRGEAQRLSAQLEAAFTEIERLKPIYCRAISQLETHAVPNLSAQSAGKWFELYLRVADLGVQIRRGEIRHRTKQNFTHPCMHNTGTKGAVHSGLSIDDGNAIYLLMETRELAKERRLSQWFIRIDGLDRDDIGQLDKKLSSCLDHFLELRSAYYVRLELNGKDPHEELLALGETGVDASQKNQVLVKTSRQCFGPKKCSCKEDAEPWNGFALKPGDPHTEPRSSNGVVNSAVLAQKEDVGILDIKRQWGFGDNGDRDTDAAALARDAAELAQRRKPRRVVTSSGGGVRLAPSAKNLYIQKCEENGTKPKPHMQTILTVRNGSLQLNLSQVGFHPADDLQDLRFGHCANSYDPHAYAKVSSASAFVAYPFPNVLTSLL
ncbi:hypothetical protein BBO99_00000116 [Phytophthora kernoviae]|uniref:Uncharacterized protein n=1 Tax=Phytophthora kernoviae TaxID=325452 RepID=A0A3R7NMY4_9STRA|nr:hypothetical protein BBI17_000218 [Phytophthora kernoviae]RLN85832.1 hypothetical protein BBO99_00000116 [Phytophthora kernoviae]